MPEGSRTSRRRSIAVTAPFTAKDDAVSSSLLHLRGILLRAPEVRRRLAGQAELRPSGHVSTWAATAGLRFYIALGQLERDLDHVWTQAELDGLAERWNTTMPDGRHYKEWVNDGFVSMGLAGGRPGRGRPITPSTIGLAARSIALRASGLSPYAADERTADEENATRPLRYQTLTASTVAGYRKRLRDRREPPMTPKLQRQQVETNIALTAGTGRRLNGFHPGSFDRGCRCDDCLGSADVGG